MTESRLFDSTLALMSDKTTISETTARQIQRSNQSFAPYYKPAAKIDIDLARQRHSSRTFGSLSLASLGELLHLSLYANDGEGTRPYPAAGGIYSVSLYLAALDVDGLSTGVHFLRWSDKVLEAIGTADEARSFHQHVFQPYQASSMPLVAVMVADLRLSSYKYRDVAARMAYIEAGALLQTMYLAATKLQLPICALGGISDRSALKITQLEPSSDLIYTCGVALGGTQIKPS